MLLLLLSATTLLCTFSMSSAFLVVAPHSRRCHHHKGRRQPAVNTVLLLSEQQQQEEQSLRQHHLVDGTIECVEMKIQLPEIAGRHVTVLEATAEAQETLVNLAIQGHDDDDDDDTDTGLKLPTGDPYGAVLWPASLTIASTLLQNADRLLQGKRLVELGAGTGLVSLAAALGGPSLGAAPQSVLATDFERIPLQLLEYALEHLNHHHHPDDIDSNKRQLVQTALFDFCDTSQALPAGNVLVAADVMYEPPTGRALAHRVVEALGVGGYQTVLIGDSPGRAGRPAFLQELASLGVGNATFVDTVGSTVTGARHDLICGAGSSTVSKTPQELMVAVLELSREDVSSALS